VPALVLSRPANRAASERAIAYWLLACCAMVFAMVVIGGVTRLTESGLSITTWQPVSGIVPPLSAAQWTAAFDRYKAIPQYAAIHAGMTLQEFKGIFFWEYLHRLWGRLIGVAFALPFLYFLVRRRIPARLAPKLGVIFALGALQGAVGWYMVESGLETRIEVSQYRLALHLGMAALIYGAMLWVALDLLQSLHLPAAGVPPSPARGGGLGWGRGLRAGTNVIIALIFVTLLAGSFVAGTRAGYLDNTFPLMEGRFMPPDYWHLAPLWRNWFENLAAVQFDHRLLAETTVAAALALWLGAMRARLPAPARAGFHALAAMALVQLGLGIATLLSVVDPPIAVLHQAGAILLLTVALVVRHAVGAIGT
jgi:heme a synthase